MHSRGFKVELATWPGGSRSICITSPGDDLQCVFVVQGRIWGLAVLFDPPISIFPITTYNY